MPYLIKPQFIFPDKLAKSKFKPLKKKDIQN